jgi:hypothetical protein
MSTIEIEKQRWFPQTGACALTPGGFGWSHPLGTANMLWEDFMEQESGSFLFDVDFKEPGANDTSGWFAGAYLKKSCTEYSSYPNAWKLVSGKATDMLFLLKNVFEGKGSRILELNSRFENGEVVFDAILVPNFGPARKAWWFEMHATVQHLIDVLKGEAPEILDENNKIDKSPKKLIAMDRLPDGNIAFAVSRFQRNDNPWWWAIQVSTDVINAAIKGEAGGPFKADSIKKRPVYLKQHVFDGTFTIILVPRDNLNTHYWFDASWDTISNGAKANNYRLISIKRARTAVASLSDTLFSAVLLQND